jgi:hypothetical protein
LRQFVSRIPGVETGAASEADRRVITITNNGTLVSPGDCGFVVSESTPKGLDCAV